MSVYSVSSVCRSVCLPVCLSVCLSVCLPWNFYHTAVCLSVLNFLPYCHHRIFMELTPDIHVMKCLQHAGFHVKKWKIKIARVIFYVDLNGVFFNFHCVRSVALCLFKECALYSAQILSMRLRYVVPNSQIKRSQFKFTRVGRRFRRFCFR